jgi:hypothetical protein
MHKDHLGLRRNPIPKLRRHPVHAAGVAEIFNLEKTNFPAASGRRVSAYAFNGADTVRRRLVENCRQFAEY